MSFWEDRFVHRPHASAPVTGSGPDPTGDHQEPGTPANEPDSAPETQAPEVGHAWTYVSDTAAEENAPAELVHETEPNQAYDASAEGVVKPADDSVEAVDPVSEETYGDAAAEVESAGEPAEQRRRGLFRRRNTPDPVADAEDEVVEAQQVEDDADETVGDSNAWSSAPSFPEIAAEADSEPESTEDVDALTSADADAERWAAAAAAIEVEGTADVQHERRGLFRRRKPVAASADDDSAEDQQASSGYDWGSVPETPVEPEAFGEPEEQAPAVYGEADQAAVAWDDQVESAGLEEQPAVEHERRGLFRRRKPVATSLPADDEAEPAFAEPVSTEPAGNSYAWSQVEATDEPEHQDASESEHECAVEAEPLAQVELEEEADDEAAVTYERRGLFRRRKAVPVHEAALEDDATDADNGARDDQLVEDDASENVPMYAAEPMHASAWDASEPEAMEPEASEPELADPDFTEPELPQPDFAEPEPVEVYAVAEDSDAASTDEHDVPVEAEEVDDSPATEDVEPDAVEELTLELTDEPLGSELDHEQPFDVPVTSLQDEPVVARKRNGGSSSRGRKVVGLKVGASQIAAAVVTGSGDRPALVDIARRPLEQGVVVDGELRDPDALAHALKSFFKDHGLPPKNVRLGISSSRVGVRSFDITGIEDEERFDNAVRFKAHEVLPVAANESVLDYRVVEERYTESGEVARHVLLVVAPRDQVEPYIEACRTAGLRLAGVDLEAFGLLRAFVPPLGSRSRSEDSATVVVAIGHEASTLLVAGGGVCEFTRVFDWGGGALQAAIAEELDVPLMEAATILNHLSLNGPGRHLDSLDSDTRSRALEAVRTKLTPFARELVSSLQFYQTQPESLGIREILITGGTSHLEGLADALHQMIGVSVSVGDPLGRVTVQTEIPVALDATIGSLAVPIGLAIEDENTRSVNLMPKEARQARKSPNVLAVALPVGAAVVLAAVGFLFMQASSTVGDRQAELDAVRAEIAKLPEPTRPTIDPALAGEQAQRATAVAQVLGGRLSWERVLGDVARVLPAGVSLTELSATAPQPTTPEPVSTTEETSSTSSTPPPAPAATTPSAPTGVIVSGYAFDYESIARALARIQAIPSLSNAQLQSATPANLGTKRVIEFTIVADLATTGGVQ